MWDTGCQPGSGQYGTQTGSQAVVSVGHKLVVRQWSVWDTDWQSGSGQCGTQTGTQAVVSVGQRLVKGGGGHREGRKQRGDPEHCGEAGPI